MKNNSFKWQSLILVCLILFSVLVTKIEIGSVNGEEKENGENPGFVSEARFANLSYERNMFTLQEETASANRGKVPERDWNVLNPSVQARSVLIQSLDENYPFFHYHTYEEWPIASLTKLVTAVVVLEEIGEDKKISMTQSAIDTEGMAGDLVSGEVYTSRDLLKIMLLVSSNDAATAFEEYFGGRTEFARLLNRKARELGMTQTILHDASGLSDLNVSTASDLLKLTKYIIEKYPEIFNWTRSPFFLVQPINDTKSRNLVNINPFVDRASFLGGKTGTHPNSRENIIAIFSLGEFRVVEIILGSPDRVAETDSLFNWIRKAYAF